MGVRSVWPAFRAIAAAVHCWWNFVCVRITCGKLKAQVESPELSGVEAGAGANGSASAVSPRSAASLVRFNPNLYPETGSTQEAADLVRTESSAASHHAEPYERRGGERPADAECQSDAVVEQADGPGTSTRVGDFPAHATPVLEKADGQAVQQAIEPARRGDEEAVANRPPGKPSGSEGELQKVLDWNREDDARGEFAQASPTSGEVEESGPGAGDSGVSTGSPSGVAAPVPTTPPHNREQRRRPPVYRAPIGGPSTPPNLSRATDNASTSPSRGRWAPVEVRVLFARGGYCTVTLLPKRPPGLRDELTVSSDIGELELVALADEWYQDIAPENLGRLLRAGFVWTDEGSGQEWLLSGREVFVLAASATHRGYVSCPRLVLGREHVVLCTTSELPGVEEVLQEAGCPVWTKLDEADGAPAGWVVLRGIVPQRPVRPSSDADILNILRPLAEIEIALEGGIRLAHNSWLLGHPPTIRVYGNPEHTERVLIDGQEAVASKTGGYTTPEWDEEGGHQILCSSTNKSYSLVRCKAGWRFWPAYSFCLTGSRGGTLEFAFCGPLVRPVSASHRTNSEADEPESIQVPRSNPVLLGSQPGQVLVPNWRRDIRSAQCLAVPPFAPVWALPAQPLNCDKGANRVLLIGERLAVGSGKDYRQLSEGTRAPELRRWCRLILDAGRKGLAVDPPNSKTEQLWREYRRYARSLWRKFR